MDIAKPSNKFSQPFLDMAARIERNLEGEFAGAMLFVPAKGEPIAVLLTDPSQDNEALFAVSLSKIQMAAPQNQPQDAFGQRRR